MSKTEKNQVPVFGEPVYVITANKYIDSNLLEKVKRKIACLSSIKYYAVEAILVSKLAYTEDMTGIIINEGMIDAERDNQSLEIIVKLDEIGEKIYVTKEEAALVANEMNEEEKARMADILDSVQEAYNKADEIILAQQ